MSQIKRFVSGSRTILYLIPFIALAFLLFLPVRSSACTGVYVGAEASSDGTILLGKSNDTQGVYPNHVIVEEPIRKTDIAARLMPIDNADTILDVVPETTYRYTCTPYMDYSIDRLNCGRDATVAANEKGVSMLISITAFTNDSALQADPLIDNGLTELTAADLVVCQSDSARQAVKTLAHILDLAGSSECNIAFIADQTSAWYVEIYTGYQYAAVKLPADKVCVFGNEFTLEYLSDYEESITSPNLEKLAVDNGFARYGENGELNIFETYSGSDMIISYSHRRTWIGHQLLAPSVYGDDYDPDFLYPLCFEPDRKVSLQDVMEVLRNRYEGTPYSPDETGRTDMRVIGSVVSMSVHITQTYPNLPTEMSVVTWESTGPALYGVFIPVSNDSLKISDAYSRNQPAGENHFDTEQYPWYAFKALNTLCMGKENYIPYGTPVRNYWHQAETGMIAGMNTVLQNAAAMTDSAKAAEYITDYCCSMQEQAFADAKELLNDVLWTQAENSNTLKNGRNPETHEILDELKPVPPVEINLDGSIYRTIPVLKDQAG